jgi:predicted ATP-binding protein involved in virulence
MFLKRVQVPDFRALKNVDISFEQQLTPHVFPVGSQNGGGKSTLLQLIFVLLHCSTNPNVEQLFDNFFQGFRASNTEKRKIASFEIINHSQELVELNFFSISATNLAEYYRSDKTKSKGSSLNGEIQKGVKLSENNIEDAFHGINKIKVWEDRKELLDVKFSAQKDKSERSLEISNLETDIKAYSKLENSVRLFLESLNVVYISRYLYDSTSQDSEGAFIVCEVNKVDSENDTPLVSMSSILEDISSHVFLAAPSTQVFLFMPSDSRKKILSDPRNPESISYFDELQLMKDKISNFFTYDFLVGSHLIDMFKKARDQDYASVVKTGSYGRSYHNLLNNMNSILSEKRINSREDLSGIQFFIGPEDHPIEIYPEDLSHGELKRFGVYMWLLSVEISHSIVLMDEIELALHPDWQQQIVRDLVDWGPTNQYILATHSYSLCEAVTPAHVKEISPHFLSSSSSK